MVNDKQDLYLEFLNMEINRYDDLMNNALSSNQDKWEIIKTIKACDLMKVCFQHAKSKYLNLG